jgi:hypothetical protein
MNVLKGVQAMAVAFIAVVGDEKWRDKFLMYLGAGHRKAAVEYFLTGKEARARGWPGEDRG